MPEPAIIRGSEHFFNIVYEGNGGGQKVGTFIPFTDNGTIAKSVIFNDDDNAYLSRTNDAGDRDTFTVSVWVKRSITGAIQHIFDTYDGSSDNDGYIRFNADNTISTRIGSPSTHLYTTNRTFEDTTKWYHLVLSVNTNESTADDRVKLYADGDLITSYSTRTNPGQGDNTQFNYSSATFRVGSTTNGNYDYDGYIAEFNLVDGSALTPSTFGVTDTSSGRWVPKTLTGITYGTNGHRLEFANSAGQTIGDDTSSNTNDFTVSGLATTDITTDSPTQNFATGFHDQSDNGTITRSEGNLKAVQGNSTSKFGSMRSTLILDPNDPNLYYCEYKVNAESGGNGTMVGFSDIRADGKKPDSSDLRMDIGTNYFFASSTYIVHEIDGSDAGTGNDSTRNPSYTTNDVMGLAFQAGKVWIAKNNTWSNSGNPSAGTGHLVELSKNSKYRFLAAQYGASTGHAGTFNFGQKSFTYTPPTGAKNLQQDNLPAGTSGIPDMVWIKGFDTTYNHLLIDSTRGGDKQLQPNVVTAQATQPDMIQKFLVGGYQTEDFANINTVGQSYVAMNWVAGGGTTSANSDGSGASIASTIQKNETAGFSIVSYSGSGTGSSVAGTVAHGLSKTPECIWIKSTTAGNNWVVYHHSISDPSDKVLYLNDTNAETNWPYMGDTDPTNKVFTISSDLETGRASNDYMAYCWYGVDGYSKFGTYEGNNNNNGAFVYLGFKPALLIVKSLDEAYGWRMYDNANNPTNPVKNSMLSNVSTAMNTSTYELDFLANGFKMRDTYSSTNAGVSYCFMAWAERPFIGSGTNPITAR